MKCSTNSCHRNWLWLVLLAAGVIVAYALLRNGAAAENMGPADKRQAMADFSIRDLSGKMWKLSDHRGQVVLVNFWATWCPPCQHETPDIVKLANDYSNKGLSVIGLSLDQGGAEKVRNFVNEYKIPYPVALANGEKVAEGIDAIPVSILLDRQGRVAFRHVGTVDEKTLKGEVDQLLAEK